MGYFGNLHLHQQIRQGLGHKPTLDEIADLIGGEARNGMIYRPSPGYPSSDRSCVVKLYPNSAASFHIYDCLGSADEARLEICFALGIEPTTQDHSAAVQQIWSETVPADGTLVEDYLKSRALDGPIPACLRFHPSLRHKEGFRFPAMVAAVEDDRGLVAIHRTFLSPSGGKAPVEPNKMSLGPIGGCAVRLASAVETLCVSEGIETALSAMQSPGRHGWSALSAVGLRTLELPDVVQKVIILADRDAAGEAAARAAEDRWLRQGRKASIAYPPEGFNDFNDALQGGRG